MALDLTNSWAQRPAGMRDLYPQHATLRRRVEDELLGLFASRGFAMVSCGAFEYVETLTRGRAVKGSEQMVQWFDANGRAVALRTDMTPSIARMAAPLVANGRSQLKWSYAERVYHRTTDPASLSWASGQAAEATQVGVEWIGASGAEADAHLLDVCRLGLEQVGLTDWQMVVSHANIAPALLEAAGVAADEVEPLLTDLTQGDYVSFQETLRQLGVEMDVLREFSRCDPLRPQTLDRLVPGGDHQPAATRARAAWQELIGLAKVLQSIGLAERVSFDLTLHRDRSYYTGLVFEVFSPGVGAPVAQGGRYDDLLASFGAPAPAVGFTFEVERVFAVVTEGGWLHGDGEGHSGREPTPPLSGPGERGEPAERDKPAEQGAQAGLGEAGVQRESGEPGFRPSPARRFGSC